MERYIFQRMSELATAVKILGIKRSSFLLQSNKVLHHALPTTKKKMSSRPLSILEETYFTRITTVWTIFQVTQKAVSFEWGQKQYSNPSTVV